MATTDKRQQTVFTPEEVQRQIQTAQTTPMQAQGASMNGYQPVTAVDASGAVPQSSAWRDVQRTGNAKTDYKAIMGAQPGAYRGMYQQPMQQTLNNLLNQREYNYDVNTDALYQNIKDNYIKQGRQAMMDTQGASAALTGGYGNSYGVLAGQQAYQDSLGNLSAQIPELYQLAYQRYLGNENSQRQNLAALQGLDESEYQRYQYDTQQYESRLADAYAKYQASIRRSGGSGGMSFTDMMNLAYGLYGSDEGSYNSQSGLRGDAAVDAGVKSGKINARDAAALKEVGSHMTNQQRKQQGAQIIQGVMDLFSGGNKK
jgi:hypothetical protein